MGAAKMMDLEELKNLLRCPKVFQPTGQEAASAIESLQAKVAELERNHQLLKIEEETFRHGYRIASDRCAALEKDLPTTYLQGYGDALDHAAMYVDHHCVDGQMHSGVISNLARPKVILNPE